jgi:hypothetical protein
MRFLARTRLFASITRFSRLSPRIRKVGPESSQTGRFHVVAFYNKRGICEQWIKEGKGATTEGLSCLHRKPGSIGRLHPRGYVEHSERGDERDQGFFCCRFRNRTPGPPPSSSMNSTPPLRRAIEIFFTVSPRPPNSPFADSSRAIVGSETPEWRAKSDWDQPRSARAAFSCLIVINNSPL